MKRQKIITNTNLEKFRGEVDMYVRGGEWHVVPTTLVACPNPNNTSPWTDGNFLVVLEEN